jgi:hypothetical protein
MDHYYFFFSVSKRREVEKMFVEYLIYTPDVVYYESIKRDLKKRPVYRDGGGLTISGNSEQCICNF